MPPTHSTFSGFPFDIGDEVRVTTGSYPFTTSEVGIVVSLSWGTHLAGVRYEVAWPAGLGLEFRGTPAHSVTQLRDHELVLVKKAPSKAPPLPAPRPFEVGDWVMVTGDLPCGVGHIETVSTTVWSTTRYLGEYRYTVVFPSGRRISGVKERDLILAEEPVRLPPLPAAPAPSPTVFQLNDEVTITAWPTLIGTITTRHFGCDGYPDTPASYSITFPFGTGFSHDEVAREVVPSALRLVRRAPAQASSPAPAPEVPSPKRRYEVVAEPLGPDEVHYRVRITHMDGYVWPLTKEYGPFRFYTKAAAFIGAHQADPESAHWESKTVFSEEV